MMMSYLKKDLPQEGRSKAPESLPGQKPGCPTDSGGGKNAKESSQDKVYDVDQAQGQGREVLKDELEEAIAKQEVESGNFVKKTRIIRTPEQKSKEGANVPMKDDIKRPSGMKNRVMSLLETSCVRKTLSGESDMTDTEDDDPHRQTTGSGKELETSTTLGAEFIEKMDDSDEISTTKAPLKRKRKGTPPKSQDTSRDTRTL